MDEYKDAIEKFRLHPNRNLDRFLGSTLEIDRLVVANRLLGGMLSNIAMIWDSKEVGLQDFWLFYTKNYKDHVEGYLNFLIVEISSSHLSTREYLLRLHRQLRSLSSFERYDRLTIGIAFVTSLLITVLVQNHLHAIEDSTCFVFSISETLPIVHEDVLRHCLNKTDLLNSIAPQIEVLRDDALVSRFESTFAFLRER